MLLNIIRCIRPKQWTKNLLVFAGLLFTLNSRHPASDVLKVVLAFVIFCLLSGSVYLVNDVLDAEKDRKHPKKRYRPIACGKVSPRVAVFLAVALGAVSLAAAFRLDFFFGLVTVAYLLLSTSYSFVLKHLVIVDVFSIAAGFVLRAAAGALVIHVTISEWLLLCTTLLALFMGLAKRRNELVTLDNNAGEHRKILEEYSPALLDQMINVTAACTIVAYMFYTFLSRTGEGSHRYMMMTIPFVIYGLFRYLYLVHSKNLGGSPESVVIEDKPLLVNIILWMVTVAVVFMATK
ncbi:MAG: decaprenyl-phosphate phosphoribosyltransferase [Armatimonadota bacterium]|nr:decaprenyl-phosphate phosphoribosyltransferase [Armatimonadota bacterium]